MVKCEVKKGFDLKDFDKLENLVRAKGKPAVNGHLNIGDTFECDEEMAKYLTGNNPIKQVVVDIIEVIPEVVEAKVEYIEEPVQPKAVIKPLNKKKKKN